MRIGPALAATDEGMGAVRGEIFLFPFDEQTDQYTRTTIIQLNSLAAEGGGEKGGGGRTNGPAHDMACPSSKFFAASASGGIGGLSLEEGARALRSTMSETSLIMSSPDFKLRRMRVALSPRL
jgi:hypothetical protein